MEFALFYEIPVARPWNPDSERHGVPRHPRAGRARRQARLPQRSGRWSTTSCEEYSHCSNPEVLYGAIAARTENIRLGYGVRLLPKPYNHPVRSAESAAVLDLMTATGGSSSAPAARRRASSSRASASTPTRRARCGRRRSTTSSAAGPTRSHRVPTASTGRSPQRRVQPKPLQNPHPPIWGATGSESTATGDGRARPRTVLVQRGLPPEELEERSTSTATASPVHEAHRQVRERPARRRSRW